MISHSRAPARRAVLGALALGAVGSIAGCDLRLERDAPAIPGIKTQDPPADSAAFTAALASSRTLMAVARTEPKPWGPRLSAMHSAQHTRLIQVMATDGISAGPSTPGAEKSPSVSTVALGVLEISQVNRTALQYARAGEPANISMFCSLLASYVAAAAVLDPAREWRGPLPDRRLAVALVPAVRRAVYTFEVIAAQTSAHDRGLVTSTVVALTASRSRLEAVAGAKAPAAPLSYRLPIAPTTAATRTALGRAVLTDLMQATARAVPANHATVDAVQALVREWGDFTALGWRWSLSVTPFPGLAA